MERLTTASASRRTIIGPIVLAAVLLLGPATVARLISGITSITTWPLTQEIRFDGSRYEIANLELLLIYIIAVLGLNLFFQTGFFSLGHNVFFLVGAYAVGYLAVKHAASFWWGLLLSVVLTAAVALVLALPATRLGSFTFAMITLGYAVVAADLVLEWESVTGGGIGLVGIPRPAPFDSLTSFYWLVAAFAFAAFLMARNLIRSPLGRAAKAVEASPVAAQSLGVNVARIKVVTFTISAVFAGVAGALFAPMQTLIGPTSFTVNLSVLFLLMVLLGGSGTVVGPVVGAILLFRMPLAIQDVSSRPGDVSLLVYGIVLVALIYVVPQGLMSGWWKIRRRVGQRWRRQSSPDAVAPAALGGTALSPVAKGDGPVLSLVDVHKSLGGVKALNGVSLAVAPGTVHALIGPNGSGKTTLLNVVSGYLTADQGRVDFAGTDVRGWSVAQRARHGLGRTFQTPEVLRGVSCVENVMLALDMHASARTLHYGLALPWVRRHERQVYRDALAILAEVGLAHRARDNAADLPPGERRRLEIARVIALRPRLVLMDEPAGGLTTAEIDDLQSMIERMRAAGIAVLLVEHHTELVWRVADHVTVLNFGRPIAEGEPSVVKQNPDVVRAYLGEPPAEVAIEGPSA